MPIKEDHSFLIIPYLLEVRLSHSATVNSPGGFQRRGDYFPKHWKNREQYKDAVKEDADALWKQNRIKSIPHLLLQLIKSTYILGGFLPPQFLYPWNGDSSSDPLGTL